MPGICRSIRTKKRALLKQTTFHIFHSTRPEIATVMCHDIYKTGTYVWGTDFTRIFIKSNSKISHTSPMFCHSHRQRLRILPHVSPITAAVRGLYSTKKKKKRLIRDPSSIIRSHDQSPHRHLLQRV